MTPLHQCAHMETVRLALLSESLGRDVLDEVLELDVLAAEAVGPRLVWARVWLGDSIVSALIDDPEGALGWLFLDDREATRRTRGCAVTP